MKIKAEKEDIFIEFMWNITQYFDFNNLNFEKQEFNLIHELNVIKIPKKKEYKKITFELNGNNSLCFIHQEKTIQDFYHNYQVYNENLISLNHFTFDVIDPYKNIDQLLKDEYHYVLIVLYKGTLDLKIKVEMNNKDDKNGLKSWHIALIIVGSILVLILIVVIIVLIKRKKQLSSEKIEEKIESLTSI